MHGLIFKTSIWLLAGSTRLLPQTRTNNSEEYAGSAACSEFRFTFFWNIELNNGRLYGSAFAQPKPIKYAKPSNLPRCIQRYGLPAKSNANWNPKFWACLSLKATYRRIDQIGTNTNLYLLLIAPLIINFSLIIMQPTVSALLRTYCRS